MSTRLVGVSQIARAFLEIGALSYGGPAIMGIIQTELQDRRNWLSKKEFVEGLALFNMLPGPGATSLESDLRRLRVALDMGHPMVAEMEFRGWTPASSCVIR
jgi:hypothetical protein